MAEVVNLRLARKRAQREAAARTAASNRAAHGVAKSDKTLARARTQKAERTLDGHAMGDDAED